MDDNAVIPRERTAVPVEWDEVRRQLETLSETLQPTEPGGVSPLGSVINTAADNLRGEGANIRDTVIKLSQAITALGDHSTDIFSTVKNLAILVSALQDSTDVMRQLNQNLATVTGTARRRSRRSGRRGPRSQQRRRRGPDVRGREPRSARHHVGQVGRGDPGVERQPGRREAVPARRAQHVAELREHLAAGPGRGEQRADDQQLRQSDFLLVRRRAGGVPAGCRAVGEAVRCNTSRRS